VCVLAVALTWLFFMWQCEMKINIFVFYHKSFLHLHNFTEEETRVEVMHMLTVIVRTVFYDNGNAKWIHMFMFWMYTLHACSFCSNMGWRLFCFATFTTMNFLPLTQFH